MVFGRRKQKQQSDTDKSEIQHVEPVVARRVEAPAQQRTVEQIAAEVNDDAADDFDGPFDIEDFDNPDDATQARLDLGSVLIPMPPDGQIQVEMNQQGAPSAVWVVTPNGRFTIAAYAAPKTPGLWREVAGELADSLRKDNARVSIEDGNWGREVVGVGTGIVRFIGVDGYRWMIRCVVNGAPHSVEALTAEARKALLDTVVRRGEIPLPVRSPLPVQLPEAMANQLREAAARQAQQVMAAAQQAFMRQQQLAQAQAAQAQAQAAQAKALADAQAQAHLRAQSNAPVQPHAQGSDFSAERLSGDRRSVEGSAMQQPPTPASEPAPEAPQQDLEPERRSADGSAMQQLRSSNAGS